LRGVGGREFEREGFDAIEPSLGFISLGADDPIEYGMSAEGSFSRQQEVS
jgi:hypothetical protein